MVGGNVVWANDSQLTVVFYLGGVAVAVQADWEERDAQHQSVTATMKGTADVSGTSTIVLPGTTLVVFVRDYYYCFARDYSCYIFVRD